jgi:hypothetical protein
VTEQQEFDFGSYSPEVGGRDSARQERAPENNNEEISMNANTNTNHDNEREPWDGDYDSEGTGPEADFNFGVSFDDVAPQRGSVPPKTGSHLFRITKVSTGTQQKGQSSGSKYFTTWCAVVDDEGKTTGEGISQFCGLDKTAGKGGYTQIGSTKAFLLDIGRADIMTPEGSPKGLVDTEFTAEVYSRRNTKTGEDEARMRGIKPVIEQAPAPAPAPAKKVADPTPARPMAARNPRARA